MHAKGLIQSNPCDGVKRLKVGNVTRDRVRIPTPADEARLRKHLDGYVLTAYTFARATGLRFGELRRLRKEDVDEQGAHIRQSKSGKGRVVPLNDTARDALLDCPVTKGRLLFPYSVKRQWLKARAAAKFDHTWNEATRHAFVSELLRNPKVAPLTVARLAGHSSLKMLEDHYGHVLSRDAEDAIASLAS